MNRIVPKRPPRIRPDNRRLTERRFALATVMAVVGHASGLPRVADAADAPVRTPQQTLGPFYPRNVEERPQEVDADLLTLSGGTVLAKGVPIYLSGRAIDIRGQPLAGATVEIWQCDANAVYHHPGGGAENERDPRFQGYGVARTNANGEFEFRTIRPVTYPGRTAHIHVRVQAGRAQLATQLYLPDEPGNRRDFLYSRLSPQEQAAVALRLTPTPASATSPLAQATQFTARVELVLA